MHSKDLINLFEIFDTPSWKSNVTTFVAQKFAVDVQEERTSFALSVLGHDPKNVEVTYYDDKIEVKAKKGEGDTPYHDLVSNIDERITLGKNLDAKTAKAEIKNGILLITIERKEETKPKKLSIKIS